MPRSCLTPAERFESCPVRSIVAENPLALRACIAIFGGKVANLRRRAKLASAPRSPSPEIRRFASTADVEGAAPSRLAETMRPTSSVPNYPPSRRDPDSGYMAHGRWFDDPYAWLERLEDAE